jgi:glycosyltransferase involved in cell wall biosynthesis
MRILLTIHQFFPAYHSGTEVLTYSVAKELQSRGHEVRILTAHPDPAELADEDRFDDYLFDGIPVYRFRHAYRPMGGQNSLLELSYDNHLAAGGFRRILSRYKPDLVHFFHLNRLGTGLIAAAADAGVPAYFTPTDFWIVCKTAQLVLHNGQNCAGPSRYSGNCIKHLAQQQKGEVFAAAVDRIPDACLEGIGCLAGSGFLPKSGYGRELAALSVRLETNIARLNRLQAVVAPNRLMKDLLIRYGVRPELIVESAYGIADRQGISSPARKTPRQPFRIGYIGTLIRHKGCHILLEAFNTLPEGRAVLRIYGDTDQFADYTAELKAVAGDRRDIEFSGTFPNSAIAEIMAELDVLVVPSLWHENTPLVVYSAQAAACPVVASDCPGIAGCIEDGKNGLLFEAGNVEALASRLRRLIGDPELTAALSAQAKPPKSTSAYVDDLLAVWGRS